MDIERELQTDGRSVRRSPGTTEREARSPRCRRRTASVATTTAATACLFTAVSLAGCSADGGPRSDPRPPAQTARSFFRALGHGDERAACAVLAPSAIDDLRNQLLLLDSSCGELIRFIHNSLPSAQRTALANVAIRHVTIRGNRARIAARDYVVPAALKGPINDDEATRLVRLASGWKITRFT